MRKIICLGVIHQMLITTLLSPLFSVSLNASDKANNTDKQAGLFPDKIDDWQGYFGEKLEKNEYELKPKLYDFSPKKNNTDEKNLLWVEIIENCLNMKDASPAKCLQGKQVIPIVPPTDNELAKSDIYNVLYRFKLKNGDIPEKYNWYGTEKTSSFQTNSGNESSEFNSYFHFAKANVVSVTAEPHVVKQINDGSRAQSIEALKIENYPSLSKALEIFKNRASLKKEKNPSIKKLSHEQLPEEDYLKLLTKDTLPREKINFDDHSYSIFLDKVTDKTDNKLPANSHKTKIEDNENNNSAIANALIQFKEGIEFSSIPTKIRKSTNENTFNSLIKESSNHNKMQILFEGTYKSVANACYASQLQKSLSEVIIKDLFQNDANSLMKRRDDISKKILKLQKARAEIYSKTNDLKKVATSKISCASENSDDCIKRIMKEEATPDCITTPPTTDLDNALTNEVEKQRRELLVILAVGTVSMWALQTLHEEYQDMAKEILVHAPNDGFKYDHKLPDCTSTSNLSSGAEWCATNEQANALRELTKTFYDVCGGNPWGTAATSTTDYRIFKTKDSNSPAELKSPSEFFFAEHNKTETQKFPPLIDEPTNSTTQASTKTETTTKTRQELAKNEAASTSSDDKPKKRNEIAEVLYQQRQNQLTQQGVTAVQGLMNSAEQRAQQNMQYENQRDQQNLDTLKQHRDFILEQENLRDEMARKIHEKNSKLAQRDAELKAQVMASLNRARVTSKTGTAAKNIYGGPGMASAGNNLEMLTEQNEAAGHNSGNGPSFGNSGSGMGRTVENAPMGMNGSGHMGAGMAAGMAGGLGGGGFDGGGGGAMASDFNAWSKQEEMSGEQRAEQWVQTMGGGPWQEAQASNQEGKPAENADPFAIDDSKLSETSSNGALDDAFQNINKEYAAYSGKQADLTGMSSNAKHRSWGMRAGDEPLLGAEENSGVNHEVFWVKQKAYSIPLDGFRQLF